MSTEKLSLKARRFAVFPLCWALAPLISSLAGRSWSRCTAFASRELSLMKIEQWTSLQFYELEVELHRVCRDSEEVDCFASGDVRCASESVKTPLTGELQFKDCKESVKTRERLREQPDVVHCRCRASYDFLIDKAAGNDEMEAMWRKAKAVGIKFYVTASLALFLTVVACCGFGCLEAAIQSRKPLKVIDLSMAAVLGGVLLLVLYGLLSFRSARGSVSIVSKDELHETKWTSGPAVWSGISVLVFLGFALWIYFGGVLSDVCDGSTQRTALPQHNVPPMPQQNVPPEVVGNPQDC
ncbi:unnamed protein product [Vitrella brassicaformis CCMP3155]|uniref:Transmembrane protein n=1 Tax=Vitrella brassicaformis (strain CCMP3155) TaxID=1169540 RepID=A0A0G4FQZ3_VITBC|nr:unnamed protein product [Vitrella brassicaformis CCMP3155]|eukprot:CEM16873.1 unnamed protein product [Vitrella brassicaformis CCMP3155]